MITSCCHEVEILVRYQNQWVHHLLQAIISASSLSCADLISHTELNK